MMSLSSCGVTGREYKKDERFIIIKKNVLTTHILNLLFLDTSHLILKLFNK